MILMVLQQPGRRGNHAKLRRRYKDRGSLSSSIDRGKAGFWLTSTAFTSVSTDGVVYSYQVDYLSNRQH